MGSAGKENIYDGIVTDHNMNWVRGRRNFPLLNEKVNVQKTSASKKQIKRIEPNGTITHIDWTGNYGALRRAAGCSFPGYLWHEG